MQNGQNIFHRYTFNRYLEDCEELNYSRKPPILAFKPIFIDATITGAGIGEEESAIPHGNVNGIFRRFSAFGAY